jgi:hypothetical protein
MPIGSVFILLDPRLHTHPPAIRSAQFRLRREELFSLRRNSDTAGQIWRAKLSRYLLACR